MTPSLLAALSLAYSLPAIPRAATRSSPPRLDAASDVAAWCVASERADAAVTVSGATTMAEALRDFWYVAGAMGASLGDGAAERAIAFPTCAEFVDPQQFTAVVDHINACSQMSEFLGDELRMTARHPAADQGGDAAPPAPLLLLKSYQSAGFSDFFGDDDPFAALEARLGAEGGGDFGAAAARASEEEILAETHKWVQAVIVDMKVCPFSNGVHTAGVPMGGVTYPLCRAEGAEAIYQAFWEQVEELALTDEKTLATVLLITPDFAQYSVDAYDALADSLGAALVNLGLEKDLQLVFFHPEFTFRDGKERMGGEGEAANFARRSPYPMINLLRTPQVRDAQKGIPTGAVYDVNERNMATVGTETLREMLQARDWTGLEGRSWEPHPTRAKLETKARQNF